MSVRKHGIEKSLLFLKKKQKDFCNYAGPRTPFPSCCTRTAASQDRHKRAAVLGNEKSLFASFSSEKEVCFSTGRSRTDTKIVAAGGAAVFLGVLGNG